MGEGARPEGALIEFGCTGGSGCGLIGAGPGAYEREAVGLGVPAQAAPAQASTAPSVTSFNIVFMSVPLGQEGKRVEAGAAINSAAWVDQIDRRVVR